MQPTASFEDLKIAVAPPVSAADVPSTPATAPAVSHSRSTEPPDQFFNGQWTGKVVVTPRPRVIQAVSRAPQTPRPQMVQVAPVASTPAPKPKGEEVSIFLDREQQINTRSGAFRIFVHDHGSDTISVRIGYGPYSRVKKALGTDSVGDNKTLIYSDAGVRLFHVNSPRAPHNACLIEVVSST